jgi:MFS family permease
MPSSTSTGPRRARPGRVPSGALLIAVLVIAEVVSAFESSMVFVAVPRFMEAFSASAADVGWVLTAFLLVTAASAVLTGRLGDMYGRRRVLVIVLLLSAVGSVISIVGDSLGFVIAGRALQGVAGGIMPLCFGLARALLPKERVPIAVGYIAGSALIAGALGAVISGVVVQYADWHWIFVVAGVFAVLAVAAVMAVVPRDTALVEGTRLDWLGAVLLPGGVALALLATTSGPTRGWGSTFVLGLFLAGGVVLVIWFVSQLRSSSPMFDVRLLARRDLGLAYLITVLMALGALGVTSILNPIILVTPETAPVGFGISTSVTGYIFGASAVLGFLAAPVSGWIASRHGAARAVLLGAVLLAAGIVGTSVFRSSLPGVLVSMLVVSVGTGFAYTALPNYVVECVPIERTGETTGFATLLRGTFNSVAAAGVGTILASDVVPGTSFTTDAAYNLLFLLAGGACVLAVVLSAALPHRRPTTSDPVAPEAAAAGDRP